MHPASTRAALGFVAALATPVDLGIVWPSRDSGKKGGGNWHSKPLDLAQLKELLPRAAAANAANAAIYLRVFRPAGGSHPGVIMLDDLSPEAIASLVHDGWNPCAVVETSPGNHQAWIRLVPTGESIPVEIAHAAVRGLAARYGADPRAVSPVQPGRIPGFTNRKPRYCRDGVFPFIRLKDAHPGRVAPAAMSMLARLSEAPAQGRRAAGAHQTPAAAGSRVVPPVDLTALDLIAEREKRRLLQQFASGRRPAFSSSEVDFAAAVTALRQGITEADLESWLARRRPEKHAAYPGRTLEAARRHLGISSPRP